MSPTRAILIGATVIAASVVLTNAMRPAAAMSSGGPYQLMHHSNTSANAGVFRLDTSSGEVSYCYLTGAGDTNLKCTDPVK